MSIVSNIVFLFATSQYMAEVIRGSCNGQAWKKTAISSQRLLGEYNTSEADTLWECATECTVPGCKSFGFDVIASTCLLYPYLVWAGAEFDNNETTNFSYYWKHEETCPELYTFEEDMRFCYRVSKNTKTWIDALGECHKDGAHMAMANTQEKYDLFINVVENADFEAMFLGSTDSNIEGEWFWSNGERVQQWSEKQPNNFRESEHCYLFRSSGGHDTDCTKTKNYVCEIPMIY